MSMLKLIPVLASLVVAHGVAAEGPNLGLPLSPEEIPTYARYVMPDGKGLPDGHGTAVEGAEIWAEKCSTCHGETGVEGPVTPPVGPNDIWAKPAGKYWRYSTTLFDYIRRAMPIDAPKSLTDEEVYALSAYILYRNDVIAENDDMNAESLPAVEMPNRDNFTDVWATQGARPW